MQLENVPVVADKGFDSVEVMGMSIGSNLREDVRGTKMPISVYYFNLFEQPL